MGVLNRAGGVVWGPAERGAPSGACKGPGHRSGPLAQAGFTPAEHIQMQRGPRKRRSLLWGGKKKMRSLGSVQLPTEAFMAVLKLDEE